MASGEAVVQALQQSQEVVVNSRKLVALSMFLFVGGAACGAARSVAESPPAAGTRPDAPASASAAAVVPSAAPAEPACPAIQTYPLTIGVQDGKSGQPICDADISVTDVADGRPLVVQRNPATCRTVALDGWNGEFIVKGTRSGFELGEERARVVKTRCGFDNTQVTLWLKPAPLSGQ